MKLKDLTNCLPACEHCHVYVAATSEGEVRYFAKHLSSVERWRDIYDDRRELTVTKRRYNASLGFFVAVVRH